MVSPSRLKAWFKVPASHPSLSSDFGGQGSCTSSVLSVDVPVSVTDRYPFPLKPKHVKRARHEFPPQYLPEVTASVKDVRYFLYSLLTDKRHDCAKKFPEWILETCMAFQGNGFDLRNQSEQQLLTMCPVTAVAVGIRSSKHKRGDFVPAKARADIGRIIANFVMERKSAEQQEPLPDAVHRCIREERQRAAEALTHPRPIRRTRSTLSLPSTIAPADVRPLQSGYMSAALQTLAHNTWREPSIGPSIFSPGSLLAQSAEVPSQHSIQRPSTSMGFSSPSVLSSDLRGSRSTDFTNSTTKTSPPESFQEQGKNKGRLAPRYRQSAPSLHSSTTAATEVQHTSEAAPSIRRHRPGSQSVRSNGSRYSGGSSSQPQNYAPLQSSRLRSSVSSPIGLQSESVQAHANDATGSSDVPFYNPFRISRQDQRGPMRSESSRSGMRSRQALPTRIVEESEGHSSGGEDVEDKRHESGNSCDPKSRSTARRSSLVSRHPNGPAMHPTHATSNHVASAGHDQTLDEADDGEDIFYHRPKSRTFQNDTPRAMSNLSTTSPASQQYSPDAFDSIEDEYETLRDVRTGMRSPVNGYHIADAESHLPEIPERSAARRPPSALSSTPTVRPYTPSIRDGAISPNVRFADELSQEDLDAAREASRAARMRRYRHGSSSAREGSGTSDRSTGQGSSISTVRDV